MSRFSLCNIQYPVSFALNLAVPADKLAKGKKTTGQLTQKGQNDEADVSRTQVSETQEYSKCLRGMRVFASF